MTKLPIRIHRLGRRRVLVALTCGLILTSLFPLTDVRPAAAAGLPWVVYAAEGAPSSLLPINVGGSSAGPKVADLPATPGSIALSPDGGHGYIVGTTPANPPGSATTGTLTAVDLDTGQSHSLNFGQSAFGVAVAPDGTTAYVSDLLACDSGGCHFEIRSFDVTTSQPTPRATTQLDVPSLGGVAVSPDGNIVYAVHDRAIGVFGRNLNFQRDIPVAATPVSIALSPNGSTAYVLMFSDGEDPSVVPVQVPNGPAGTPIALNGFGSGNALALAVSPDNSAVWVADGEGSILKVGIPSHQVTATPIIRIRSQPQAVAVTPDGRTVYSILADGQVTSIDATVSPAHCCGPLITPGQLGESLAITPDQAPVATFAPTTGVAGQPTTFNASASTVKYGSITDYAWGFGDGSPVVHTSTPTITHIYAAPGTYNPSVTETDSGGTSLSQVFTGQTMLRNGGPSARRTISINVPPPTSTTNPTTGTTPPTTPTTGTTTTTAGAPPTLAVSPTVGPPGQVVQVTGSGFLPNTTLTLAWQPGIGTLQATTDASGGLQTQVLVFPHDELGPTQLVAQSSPSANAAFLVTEAPGEPGGSDALVLYRR